MKAKVHLKISRAASQLTKKGEAKVTENDDSKLRGILFWTSGALLGGGIMLGCMASKWPTECHAELTDKHGVIHELIATCK